MVISLGCAGRGAWYWRMLARLFRNPAQSARAPRQFVKGRRDDAEGGGAVGWSTGSVGGVWSEPADSEVYCLPPHYPPSRHISQLKDDNFPGIFFKIEFALVTLWQNPLTAA